MSTQVADITDQIAAYVADVLDGRVVANRLTRLAAERWRRDCESGENRGLRWNPFEAEQAVRFIECLNHSKGKQWAGNPLKLEPWQKFIVGNVFGWQREDHTHGGYRRRFNTAFVSVARKNGKSTLGAAVGHKLFIFDGEPGAEVYTAATKRDQARIVHEEAKRMVRSSPALKTRVRILRDNMHFEAANSKYEPLGQDSDTLDGLNVSGAIIDEVHAHKNRELWDVLESATAARQDPLMFAITTAGDAGNRESIYLELKAYSVKVLEQIVEDDTWFAYLAGLDSEDSWTDESVWGKANPNLGISVDIDDLRRKATKAKETPTAVANFRRKHCNEDVESLQPWLDAERWRSCSAGGFYDEHGLTESAIEQLRGRKCFVGADLSSTQDLTALAFAFPDGERVDLIVHAWCPRNNAVGRTRDDRTPYLTWADRGRLTLTEGDSVDYDVIRSFLRRARDEWGWRICEVAIDPNNARYVVERLTTDDGFRKDQIVEHLQMTPHMNDPISQTEKAVLDGTLYHGGHEALAWCVSNVVIYSDMGGRRRFDKKNKREKIDLAVAAVMAVGRAKLSVPRESPYATRGFRTL